MMLFLKLVLGGETLQETFGVLTSEKTKVVEKKVDPRFKLVPQQDEYQYIIPKMPDVVRKQYPVPVNLSLSKLEIQNRLSVLQELINYNSHHLPSYKQRLDLISQQLIIQDPAQVQQAIDSLNQRWVSAVGWLKNNKGEIFSE